MINRLLTTGCKILILLLLFWLPGLKSFEATITSRTAGGAWSTPGTWVGGAVPLATDLVVIPSNSVVTTGGNQTCAGITISGTLTMATGNTLTVNGNVSGNGFWITGAGTMTISLTGNWSFNGTSTGAGATAIFTGSANQTLSGIITTGTTGSGALIINKPTGTVTLGSSITITGPFTLTSGTFDPTNNRLSASSGTINGGTLRVGTATWPENYTFTPVPAAGTTIDYYGSSPTINAAITYQNLKFSGTGTTSATGDLTIQGDLTNTGSGTLNFGSNNVILSGTVAANTIAGFTTTGSVSMTKTAGTATFNGNVNATDLNITGIGGTLNLGIGFTDTFTGNWNMTAGTLNGGSSTLAIDGSGNVTGGTFIANTGTVDYYGTGQRTIAGVIYYNATFEGSSNLNLPVGTQITGTAAINQSAKVNTVTGQNIPVSILSFDGVIQINGTWGSNQSPATNQDQKYFSGSGIMTVGDLRVTPVFSGLTASQNVCFGATTLALSGIISAAGPVYPVSGEPVAVTINGITQNAIIAGGTGGFSLNFPISSIPYSATSYTITYAYSGDANLRPAAPNTSTTLTFYTPLNLSSQSTGGQTQCAGGTFTPITVSATGSGLTYQWYSNATATITGGTSLGSANGAQTNSYTPQAAIAGTTYYYCIITGSCSTVTSAVSGAFLVNPASVGGTIGGAVTEICQGGATGTMTLSGFAGSIVRWERQVNSLGWSSVGNFGGTTYAETPFSGGNWQYRALVQNGSCPQVYSTIANVLVDSTSAIGFLGGATTPICQGASIGLFTLAYNTGKIVQWEKRLNGGAWTIIANNTRTYTEIPSASGTWDYRVLVQSGICSSIYSNISTVVVNPTLTITLGPNPMICKNTTVAQLSYTATTGNPNAYYITFDAAANAAGMGNVPGWGLPGSPININVPYGIAAGVYNALLYVATTFPVCSSITYPISVTVQDNTAPITITGNSTPCQGSSQTYNATSLTGATYSWAFPSGWTITAGSTTSSVTVTVGATAGNVQVSSSFSCGGSGTNQTLAVTPSLSPTAAITYASTPFCTSVSSPQSVTLTGTSGGTYSASPSGLTINPSTGAITPSSSTPGTYTVTYNVTSSAGCGSVTASTTVTITALPTATISYSGTPFCSSAGTQSVTLSGTGAYTGGTFSSAAGLSINSTTGLITPGSSTPGSYTVTYAIPATGGCTPAPATTNVTITPLPVATYSYTGSPYCSNGTNPTPTFSGGGVAGTFSSTAGLNFISTSTGQINLATSTPGTYTVTNTIAAANGCGVVTGTNTITITVLPTAVISYSGSPFCSSLATAQTVSISGTGAYTGGTYSSTTGLTINSATGAIIPNTSTAGSYTVTYTVPASGGCGSVTTTAPVTITALPTAAISYTGSPYCSSLATIQSVNLTGTGAYTGGTFSSTAGLAINSGTGAITPNTSTVGSYLVTYTIPASGGCASIPATTSVTITSPPVVTFSYTGSPYCTNGANPSPTFSGGGVAGAFSSSAGLNFVSTSTGQINLATSTPGTYTVTNTISGTSSCAQVVSTSQVTINPATVINSQSTGTQSQCPGGTFSAFSVSATGFGTLLYQWYSNATATTTGGTSLGTANGAQTNSYTPQAASAGTTYYYCVVTGGCGTATSAVSGAFIVNPASVGGTIGGAVTEVCQGGATGTMTLTGFAGSIIQWERQVNSLGWSSVGNGGSATYAETPFSGGRWQYRALIQNGSCAQVYSALANVLVDSTTTVGNLAGATTPICQGASIGLLTLSSRTGSIIQWEKRLNAGAWTIIPNTTRTYTEIPSSGGTWDYRVLVQSGICSSIYSNIFTVVVNPTLTITLGPNPVICKNTTVAVLNYTATTGNPTAYSITFDAAAIAAGMPNVPPSGLPGSPININVPFGIAAGVYNALLSVATTTPVCSSITYPINITIQDNTIPVTITGSTSPCQGSSQIYNATTLTGASYNWVFPSGWTVTAGPTTSSVTVTVGSTAGNVQVTPVFTCGGSGTTQTLAVTPVPSPTAAISYAGIPFCSSISTPQSVTLTGTSGGTFSASPSGLTINSSTGAITPSTSTAGTYTVTYNFTSPAGCGVVTASTNVTISALPTATISYGGSPFCSSAGTQAVTLSGTGSYTGGTFTSAAGLSINGTTGLITPASSTPGNYTVTYTIPASGGCATVPVTTNVTITTLPTATISYAASSYCTSVVAAQPVTITGTTGGTFSASPAGLSINSVTGAITPGTSTAGSYTVTYTIASAGGCGPVTATASILITTVSTAVISYAGSPFCSSLATAQSVNLTGTGAYTGGTYTSTTGLTINSGTGAITPGTSSVGSYTVTYTIPASGGCASVPATTSVSITSSPVATFSYTGSPYCSNGTNPTPTFIGGGVAGTFSSSSGLNFVSASTGQVNLATSTPGTYTVTKTIAAANGCGTVTATNTITITALPAATISYPGSPYCKSLLVAQPVTLTGTTGGTFSATPAGLSLNSSTGAITPGTSTAGAYTVTYSISAGGGCGAVTATAPVTITAVPTAAINYTGSPFCSSIATAQSVNLTGTGAYTGGTYSSTTGLTINSGTGSITPSTSTVGTYTVTYTIPASGGCASVPATTSISITSLPVATFSYTGSPYCLNGTNPTPTFSGGGIAGVFSSTAGLNFTDTSTGQINLSTSTSGTYTVTNTIAASGGCAQTNSTSSVIINPSTVIISQSTGPQTKCIGGTFSTISVTASGPGLTYQWYSKTTAVNTGGTSLGSTNGARTNRYTLQASVAGTLYYYCVVTGTCGTVTSAVSGAFVVNPATAITGQSTATQTQCIGGTFTPISVTAVGAGLSYQWYSNTTASNSSGTSLGSANGSLTSTYTPQTTKAGTLYYYCVVTGTCGTVTSAVSGAFVVNPATAISSQLTTAQTQCINGAFTPISVAATGVVLTYQWYRNASASNSSGTSLGTANGAQTSSYTPQATATGTIYYYCIVTGTCGTVTSAVSGAFVVNPATAISSQSTATQTQCITGTFTPISVTATGVSLTYQWYSNTSASNSSGTSLGAANGAQTSSYTPQATAAGTLYYYCIVTGTCGTVTSAVSGAFITNPATAISSQLTGAQSQCIYGTFAPISVTASGTGVLTYQWYSNTISANSGGLSLGTSNGAQTSSYTPQATTAGTLYYYCVVTGSCGSVTSNVSGTFTVNPATSITSQSTTGQTTCLNVPFTSISITASGTGTLTYQWYSNATTGTSGGLSLGSGNGAQTNTYNPQSFTAGTLYYYCVVHSDCGSDITSSISGAFIVIADLTWTGAISTDWNTIGNWSCPFLPDLTKNVLIPNVTNQPVLSSGPTGACKNLVINSGSSLTVIGNTLQIAETITNSGIFTASAGTIEMKGTTGQTIGANTFAGNALLNLTISNATGVTLAGPLNVTGVVKASVGNLSSGGNLTLISTALQTALVDGSGSGDVLGNVTMQRYLPSSYGYKYFSSPFQSATVNEFANDLNLASAFPSFYKYDEDNHRDSLGIAAYSSGWVNYTATTGLLNGLSGYAANFGTSTSSRTVDMTGVVNNGSMSVNLFNHNRKYTKGFNLAGNPYPSPIDWDATSGWTKTNIDNAIYFFNAGNTDQYTGVYSSYINGHSTGNGDNVIASMQGFFVHVSDGAYPVAGTLGMTNAVRINNLVPAFREAVITGEPVLTLSAMFTERGTVPDASVLYFDSQGTKTFDKTMDALKIMNTDLQVPNIYILSEDSRKLSIKAITTPADSITKIPLGIYTLSDGWISISTKDIGQFSSYLYVYLVDADKGITQDLKINPEYKFYVKTGTYDKRFSLVFSLSELKPSAAPVEKMFTFTRSATVLKVTMNLPYLAKGTLFVTNTSGQILLLRQVTDQEIVEINPGISSGLYIITVTSGNKQTSEKILMRKDYE